MGQLPYFFAYFGFTAFTLAVIARIIMWSNLPMHLRWELYPVAHEPADRVHYGGSFMEESEWWKRPRRISRLSECKTMLLEIFLLAAVKEHNRKLWTRTFPFHLGLYLASGAALLTLLTGALGSVAPAAMTPSGTDLARSVVIGLGVPGLTLGIAGALGLLQRRLTDPSYRAYTVPADIFNLLFFVVAFGSGLVCFVVADQTAEKALNFATGLVSFKLVALTGNGLELILPVLSTSLLSLLIAYVPLTHMSHFVGKYFAYHAIRWNDAPNLPGGPDEARIQQLLSYKVSWAAAHIRGMGKKSWLDVAQENPTENGK